MTVSKWRNGSRIVRSGLAGATALLVLAVAVGDRPEAASFSHGGTATALTEIAEASPTAGAKLRPYAAMLGSATDTAPALPADPAAALISAVDRLAEAVGFPQSASGRVRAAAIPPEVAGRMALLLDRMYTCHSITNRRHGELIRLLPTLFRSYSALADLNYPDVVDCAPPMWAAMSDLERAVRAASGPDDPATCTALAAGPLDIWPVLRFEPGCGGQTYQNDYLLVADVGGNDTYSNNIGSNVVDINFSPPGAAVTGLAGTGPAKGCQRGLSGLFRKDCSVSAAVLLDMHGNDVYGVLESPDSDQICTADPVVRRMLTGGAAFLGVGILRDAAASDDRYVGKTIALGSGHMFGVGILSDAGGDDSYLAVRNSMGFALMGGLGLLRDEGGNDTYDYYMPRPLDPAAANQTDGAGGVRDNEGDGVCDRIPRYTLGGGNMMGASGVLIDEAGNDVYRGAFTDVYETNPAIPGMSLAGGSAGYGGNGGLGVFLDRDGQDSYRFENAPQGSPSRADDTVIRPGSAATDAEGRRLLAGGQGIFIDR